MLLQQLQETLEDASGEFLSSDKQVLERWRSTVFVCACVLPEIAIFVVDFNYIILAIGVKLECRIIKKINKIGSLADSIMKASTVYKQEAKPSENLLLTKFLPPLTFILF